MKNNSKSNRRSLAALGMTVLLGMNGALSHVYLLAKFHLPCIGRIKLFVAVREVNFPNLITSEVEYLELDIT